MVTLFDLTLALTFTQYMAYAYVVPSSSLWKILEKNLGFAAAIIPVPVAIRRNLTILALA